MNKIIVASLCIFGLSCAKLNSQNEEKVLERVFSMDKKFKIEISDNKTDPICEQQPSTLFDNPKRIRFCFFRIIDTNNNKIIYEISPSDEFPKKNSPKKCIPSSFPLAIAYGFDKFIDNENIIFTENFAWYTADDTNITTYKFNWKTCEKTKLFNLTDEHITRSENGELLSVFANNYYYPFYFFGGDGTITVGKISKEDVESLSKNQDPFFSNIAEETPPFLFKENIIIVLKQKSSSLYFEGYKYPYLKIKISDKILSFDIRKDLF